MRSLTLDTAKGHSSQRRRPLSHRPRHEHRTAAGWWKAWQSSLVVEVRSFVLVHLGVVLRL